MIPGMLSVLAKSQATFAIIGNVFIIEVFRSIWLLIKGNSTFDATVPGESVFVESKEL